jgi:hypothetical protein
MQIRLVSPDSISKRLTSAENKRKASPSAGEPAKRAKSLKKGRGRDEAPIVARGDGDPLSAPAALPSVEVQERDEPEPASPCRVNGPTSLRKNRAVKAGVHFDIWVKILEYCPPKFLVKAREIDSTFRHILGRNTIWKRSFQNTYGESCPDPPLGLSYMQYADLVGGFGCQAKGCPKAARKIYWAFLRRWCEDCFRSRITLRRETDRPFRNVHGFLLPPDLRPTDCLVFFNCEPPNKYLCAGSYAERPKWLRSHGNDEGYEERAVQLLAEEIYELRPKTEDELVAFLIGRKEERDRDLAILQECENFFECLKRDKSERKAIRNARIDFFEERAARLDPRIEPSALHLMKPFRRAIAIKKMPVERCWDVLRPKIEKERAGAQGVEGSGAEKQRETRRETSVDIRSASRQPEMAYYGDGEALTETSVHFCSASRQLEVAYYGDGEALVEASADILSASQQPEMEFDLGDHIEKELTEDTTEEFISWPGFPRGMTPSLEMRVKWPSNFSLIPCDGRGTEFLNLDEME